MEKLLLGLLVVLALTPEAKAQEVGTYWLDKSLNKTIVYDGPTSHTEPAYPGSGTTYVHRDLPKVDEDAVCAGWAYIARRDSKRVPTNVRKRCASNLATR